MERREDINVRTFAFLVCVVPGGFASRNNKECASDTHTRTSNYGPSHKANAVVSSTLAPRSKAASSNDGAHEQDPSLDIGDGKGRFSANAAQMR